MYRVSIVPAVLSMTIPSWLTRKSPGSLVLYPYPAGGWATFSKPSTVTREKAFHFSYLCFTSGASLAQMIRRKGFPLECRYPLKAPKPPSTTTTPTARRTPRRLPASDAKATAPRPASAPTTMTELGPSSRLSSTTSRTQPMAAPMRSAA